MGRSLNAWPPELRLIWLARDVGRDGVGRDGVTPIEHLKPETHLRGVVVDTHVGFR